MSNKIPQQRIDEVQTYYREWLALQPKLEQAEQDWKKSAELMDKMQDFYFDGEFQEFFEAIDNGLDVDLKTEGEYSVMSEDAIWEAIGEHQNKLWRLMRFAVKNLDKQENDDLS